MALPVPSESEAFVLTQVSKVGAVFPHPPLFLCISILRFICGPEAAPSRSALISFYHVHAGPLTSHSEATPDSCPYVSNFCGGCTATLSLD